MADKVSNDKLRVEFQQYDKNGDGFISKDELKEVLGKVQTLTDQDLEDLIKDVDVNKDGLIDYEGNEKLSHLIGYFSNFVIFFQNFWRFLFRIKNNLLALSVDRIIGVRGSLFVRLSSHKCVISYINIIYSTDWTE